MDMMWRKGSGMGGMSKPSYFPRTLGKIAEQNGIAPQVRVLKF